MKISVLLDATKHIYSNCIWCKFALISLLLRLSAKDKKKKKSFSS